MLLFDEVQDLIKSTRLADVGGRFVFEELAVLLVAYCVDRGVMRAAVAGSSAMLAEAFRSTVAKNLRWSYHEVEDPPLEIITMELKSRGYSEDEAGRIVDLVGTRLRLLEQPLQQGAARVDCKGFLSAARTSATADFDAILDDANVSTSLLDILDQIVAHEAGRGKAPQLRHMSAELRATDFASVLYVRRDRTVTFQSQLHRKVWDKLHSQYVRQARRQLLLE